MVQKRGISESNSDEGKRPKGNALGPGDSESKSSMDEDLMIHPEVSYYARVGCA